MSTDLYWYCWWLSISNRTVCNMCVVRALAFDYEFIYIYIFKSEIRYYLAWVFYITSNHLLPIIDQTCNCSEQIAEDSKPVGTVPKTGNVMEFSSTTDRHVTYQADLYSVHDFDVNIDLEVTTGMFDISAVCVHWFLYFTICQLSVSEPCT